MLNSIVIFGKSLGLIFSRFCCLSNEIGGWFCDGWCNFFFLGMNFGFVFCVWLIFIGDVVCSKRIEVGMRMFLLL